MVGAVQAVLHRARDVGRGVRRILSSTVQLPGESKMIPAALRRMDPMPPIAPTASRTSAVARTRVAH